MVYNCFINFLDGYRLEVGKDDDIVLMECVLF